jgi:hypothetical protein
LRTFIAMLACMMLVIFVSLAGSPQAGTFYRYIDKDGTEVLTDSPPPGVKAKPVHTFRDMTEAEKQELEKEKTSQMKNFREETVKRTEKEEKVRAARQEYEQAKKTEDSYRANKNQAHGFAQQKHWINMIEEQGKVVEEKKRKLQEVESEP